jgi:predicted transcriptional regulator
MSDTPIEDGHRAALILQDEVFQRAVSRADDRFVRLWRDAETTDERERAHALQRALKEVIRELEIIEDAGVFARRHDEYDGQ